jgi:hypothetical protein
MYQHFPFQGSLKFTKIGIFGFKMYHLAILISTTSRSGFQAGCNWSVFAQKRQSLFLLKSFIFSASTFDELLKKTFTSTFGGDRQS